MMVGAFELIEFLLLSKPPVGLSLFVCVFDPIFSHAYFITGLWAAV
jgi:hypothetical protein